MLRMHYCEAYDAARLRRYGALMPTNNWMRDDELGGLSQLAPSDDGSSVFGWLSPKASPDPRMHTARG